MRSSSSLATLPGFATRLSRGRPRCAAVAVQQLDIPTGSIAGCARIFEADTIVRRFAEGWTAGPRSARPSSSCTTRSPRQRRRSTGRLLRPALLRRAQRSPSLSCRQDGDVAGLSRGERQAISAGRPSRRGLLQLSADCNDLRPDLEQAEPARERPLLACQTTLAAFAQALTWSARLRIHCRRARPS